MFTPALFVPFTIAAWAGAWYLTDRIIELGRELRARKRERPRGFQIVLNPNSPRRFS